MSNAYVRGGTGHPVTHAGTGTLAMFNCYLESTAQQFMVNHTGAGLLYYGGAVSDTHRTLPTNLRIEDSSVHVLCKQK